MRLREEIRSGKKLRTDQIYALASLHADARKELGIADNVNVKMDITEQIKVIRFEAQEPRAEESTESDVIEGEFSELAELPAEVDPDAQFRAVLREAGVRIDGGTAQPAELAAIGNAIRESGLDPREVLSDSQYRAQRTRKAGRPLGMKEGDNTMNLDELKDLDKEARAHRLLPIGPSRARRRRQRGKGESRGGRRPER